MADSTKRLKIRQVKSTIGFDRKQARVIRGMALSLRERQYVLAARALGQTHWSVITRHVLPGTFSSSARKVNCRLSCQMPS